MSDDAQRSTRWLIRLFSVGFGGIGLLLLAGAAAAFALLPDMMRAELARLEALPRVTAASIDDVAAGTTVALDGRVSARNPALEAEMVAFECTRSEKTTDGDSETRLIRSARPPLLIDAAGGSVQIGEGYSIAIPGASQDGGECDYSGLRQGDAVTVIGAAAPGAEGMTIAARMVAAMPLDAYIAAQRRTAESPPLVGVILGVLGGLFAAVGLAVAWFGRGAWRRERSARSG